MHIATSDPIAQWTLQLREVQEMLSERQRELLHAISSQGPGQEDLRRQVRALSYSAMGIIGEIERELQRRRAPADARGHRTERRETVAAR
ncbi:MAG TPA: hypothetical protein VFM98_10145 [Ramlibacter sp.]|uniref:hypothetical protein n=1 Tax=Ramlibacter sp. TaxID=1917967 RepID=UPI002D80496D|nr:hypothetical protein [Ramlibacter sp.]HET8745958.1 hypothetical protein [Ramlibacter sp.]